MRHYYTYTGMATMKNAESNKCWRGGGETGDLVYCEHIKQYSCYGNNMAASQKIKKIGLW